MAKAAVFAAAFDSQLKWCAPIYRELKARGFECRILAPAGHSALSDEQVAAAGVSAVEVVAWSNMVEAGCAADVFISSLVGSRTRQLSFEIFERAATFEHLPPVFVSGWVGVILENLAAGYLDRAACDVVAVNSTADMRRFAAIADYLDIPADNLLLTGLPFIGDPAAQRRNGPIRTVLFADQPTVPVERRDRLFLYRKLIDYAVHHPERKVVLKPRHRPGEDTIHRMKHHPAKVLAKESLPPNFSIDYTPVSEALVDLDLLLTVSSTAAIEALAAGCRVSFVADLGINERLGNHVFIESGLVRTFADLKADRIGTPDADWLASVLPPRTRPPAEVIADRVMALLDTGRRVAPKTWQTAYYQAAYGYFIESMAERYAQGHRFSTRRPNLKWRVLYALERNLPRSVTERADRLLRRIGWI